MFFGSAKHSFVVDVRAEGNGTNGISVGEGSVVTSSTARSNASSGISVTGAGVTITNCVASDNLYGIFVNATSALVVGNNCYNNSPGNFGKGIFIGVSGGDTRVEGNNVTDHNVGIHVLSSGNVIIKNSASGNDTDYAIVGGNDVGPIGRFSPARIQPRTMLFSSCENAPTTSRLLVPLLAPKELVGVGRDVAAQDVAGVQQAQQPDRLVLGGRVVAKILDG